jgi:mono/diheme cytochrome c family protein
MKKITLPLLAAAVPMLLGGVARSAGIPDTWSKNCASCHGPDGTGHTKAGRMAQVKDMTSADYQKTFTDDQATKQIKEGFKDASGKERMKAFADKLSDDEVKVLVAYVRSLSK